MSSIHTIALILVMGAGLWISPPASHADEAPGQTLAVCASCHGAEGVSPNPLVPTLAGQPYTLIEDNLLAFWGGYRACAAERDDGSPAAALARTMCSAVSGLSDEEISQIAAHYETLPFEAADQGFDANLAARGAVIHVEKGCEQCHADGGRTTQAMAPVLAGQWTPYLRRAMQALRQGSKSGPKIMNTAIHQLGEAEVEALLNFYASERAGG
jgi:sulfide dehydrogenase cytochrome subunit